MATTGRWVRRGSTVVLLDVHPARDDFGREGPSLREGPVTFETAGKGGNVEKAVELVLKGKEFFNTGGFKTQSYTGQYAPFPRPGGRPWRCIRHLRFAIYDPPFRTRRESFLFHLEYEYDGRNLLSVRIVPQVRGSSTLYKSTFEVNFDEQKVDLQDDPIAHIRWYISGVFERYDVFNQRYGFQGVLDLRANGQATVSLKSDDNVVRVDPLSQALHTICPIVSPKVEPPRLPVVKSSQLTVFFATGSTRLRPGDDDKVARWYLGKDPVDPANRNVKSLPAAMRGKIESGQLKIHIDGHASRTSTSSNNLRLTKGRVAVVKNILQSVSGLADASFVVKSLGEWQAKTKDRVEAQEERRVTITVLDVEVR